ncbi:uncharacterized protein LOC128641025 isoform X2 [Bombina bombina]|uniref:uncharacterized protein LOC128641025 isoform X2 n=1 Tax=Bombina bombina TaxID=8345 RepID=UPI00235A7596|nr:uncharacterized protein LOC128641025 isoform X2 [Bombina bombina]XP_053549524.1 uncharacterized protein LOC128641025 isoform X2 [Bombina bombina]
MSDFRCPAVLWWLLLVKVLVHGVEEPPCQCLTQDIWPVDWTAPENEVCCLNFSVNISNLDWNMLTPLSNLRILNLSNAGITTIEYTDGGIKTTNIEVLYLDNNYLKELPNGFLGNAPNLKILHIENNQLIHLPSSFLQVSHLIEELDLSFNNLTSVPMSIFKPSLTKLGFLNNSLDCTCGFYDTLQVTFRDQHNSSLLDDFTCSSPRDVSGLKIGDVKRSNLCRSHRLTVLLICIPLVVVLGLMCWYLCCHKQKESFPGKQHCSLVTVDRNGAGGLGQHPRYEPRQKVKKERMELEPNQLKDPILLKPSAALLGSSRDLYEEVEIKLGTSADSLMNGEGQISREGPGLMLAVEEEDEVELKTGEDPDVETVSVTEVMKDSSDREKLYLNQATDYYSLVPGIELDDSDHCEYESVDLS